MTKQQIQENLDIAIRNANNISDRLNSADLNVTEQRRLLNAVKKAKKILGEAEVMM
jgi:ribosomal protein S18